MIPLNEMVKRVFYGTVISFEVMLADSFEGKRIFFRGGLSLFEGCLM